jgi:hypothetical protein
MKFLQTPHRIVVLILATLVWLLQPVMLYLILYWNLEHDAYPPSGDTIAIPLFGGAFLWLFVTPIISIIILRAFAKQKKKISLFGISTFSRYSLLKNIGFAIFILFSLTLLWDFVDFGNIFALINAILLITAALLLRAPITYVDPSLKVKRNSFGEFIKPKLVGFAAYNAFLIGGFNAGFFLLESVAGDATAYASEASARSPWDSMVRIFISILFLAFALYIYVKVIKKSLSQK